MPDYKPTFSSAPAFTLEGREEDWIHLYLRSDGGNIPFSDGLKKCERHYIMPIMMPTALFERCCGPEEGMKWPEERAGFEQRVARLCEAIQKDSDMPPLIIAWEQHKFNLNDGNHRLEAYKRLNIKLVPVIFWCTGDEALQELTARCPVISRSRQY